MTVLAFQPTVFDFHSQHSMSDKLRFKRYRQLYRIGRLSTDIQQKVEQLPNWVGTWHFNEHIRAGVVAKKSQLLQIAKSGLPRQSKHKSKLWSNFYNYICKISGAYDSKFEQEIKKIRPDWFENLSTARTRAMKEKLLALATAGESRPIAKSKEGIALAIYKKKCSPNYDSCFTRKIKILAPHWFRGNHSLLQMTAKRNSIKSTIGDAIAVNPDRRIFSPRQRFDILMRDKKCRVCGRSPENDGITLEADHVIPYSHGGKTTVENGQALCSKCNLGKSNRYAA